jgi:isopenicillin N synthase-like dioxygenase
MILYRPPKPFAAIPVIDFAGAFSAYLADRMRVAQAIREACCEVGFFYLRNHGVPQALLDGQLEWTRRFFALPLAERMEVSTAKSRCLRGYEPVASQALDSGPADLRERFYLGVDLTPDHPYVQKGVPNHGPNQWPRLPGFREQNERYFAALLDLGRRAMRILALSLELEENYFDAMVAEPFALMSLIHYPPHPAVSAPNQLGAGAHTDWGGITLLLQDDAGGLEIRNVAGEWVLADPIPGTFVVNLGDMIQRWTNDLYVSNMHRVLNKRSGRDRYSVALFFNPDYFTKAECLDSCASPERPPRYAPCTVGEHIAEMYKITFGRVSAQEAKNSGTCADGPSVSQ